MTKSISRKMAISNLDCRMQTYKIRLGLIKAMYVYRRLILGNILHRLDWAR